jgi:hypothetical protein
MLPLVFQNTCMTLLRGVARLHILRLVLVRHSVGRYFDLIPLDPVMLSGTHALKAISEFKNSYALLSEAEAVRVAIVFVHGFGGSPTGSWHNFQGLVDQFSNQFTWWCDSDLFFYSYDSIKTPIRVNAVRLRSFLETISESNTLHDMIVACAKSNESVDKAFRWGSSKYTKLVLVGHSEGAVIIRRLVLDRFEKLKKEGKLLCSDAAKRTEWVRETASEDLIMNGSLCLFAPACLGTNFSGRLGFVSTLSHFFAAIAASSVVRNELLHDSPILRQIQTATEATCEEYPGISALQARVLFGTRDQVVYTGSYACDEIVEPYERGKDHFSVCKPSRFYLRPLQFVKA